MTIKSQNDLKTFTYTKKSTDPENIYANVIFEFTKTDGTIDKLSFTPQKVSAKWHTLIDPYKFNMVTINKLEKMTYRLQRTNATHKYFLIEVAGEQVKENESLITVVVEKYKETPTYISEEGVVISTTISQGKTVIIATLTEETHEDLLITVFREKAEADTHCLIKYYTAESNNFKPYEYNDNISVTKLKNNFLVKYTEILKESTSIVNSKYWIEIFDTGKVASSSIYSAYTGSSLVSHSEQVDASNDGATKNFEFTWNQEEVVGDLYLQMTLVFTRLSGEQTIEERLSYKLVKIEDQYPTIQEKKYIQSSFKSVSEHITKRLTKVKGNPVFLVEIGKDVLLSSKANGYDLRVDYKEYSLPLISGNSTDIIDISENIVNATTYLTLKFKNSATENDIILDFYLVSERPARLRALEEGAFTEVGFTMKYKTGPESLQPKKFEFDTSFSASYFLGTLTVKFREVFDSSAVVSTTNYKISLYDRSAFTTIPTKALESSSQEIEKFEIKGESKGETLKHEFSPDRNVIVSITGSFTTSDGEEFKVAYDIVDPSSYTFILIIIIVVIALILIAIGGFLIIKCLGKRKMNSELLQLSNTGKKDDIEDQKTIALVGQVN